MNRRHPGGLAGCLDWCWWVWLLVSAVVGGAFAPQARAQQKGIAVVYTPDAPIHVAQPLAADAPKFNAGLFAGVNEFPNARSLNPLRYAVNDAIAQAHLFVLELKLIPPGNACLALAGAPVGQASEDQLRALLKAGVRRIPAEHNPILENLIKVRSIPNSQACLVVVSFSSHGFVESGIPYVMPTDGIRGMLRDTALNLNSLQSELQKSQAAKRILLVDACREHAMSGEKGAESTLTDDFFKAFAKASGQVVLASCDSGQVSYEDESLKHGVFTYYLTRGLRGEAPPDGNYITMARLGAYVSESVERWVSVKYPDADGYLKQRPRFEGAVSAGQIPLAMAKADSPKNNPSNTLPDPVQGIQASFAPGQRHTNSVGMIFVSIPGTSARFSICETRVKDFSVFVQESGYDATQDVWSLQADGWKMRGNNWQSPGFDQTPDCPASGLNWNDAQAFCKWLTARERSQIGEHWVYRLPTDQEWSLAAGLTAEPGATPQDRDLKTPDVYPWGTQWPPPADAGNFAGEEVKDNQWPGTLEVIVDWRDRFARTSPAGCFKPNRFGLYDLAGNVWEWCEDWYSATHKARVLRGSAWNRGDASSCLSSKREYFAPSERYNNMGFRCVLAPGT